MKQQATEKPRKTSEQAQAQTTRQQQAGDVLDSRQQHSGSDSASVQFTDWASI